MKGIVRVWVLTHELVGMSKHLLFCALFLFDRVRVLFVSFHVLFGVISGKTMAVVPQLRQFPHGESRPASSHS